jgi:Flp pilus assembly protein TadG
MNSPRASYRLRPPSARGSIAVELALLLLVLHVLLLGMFVFGNMLLQYNVLKIASNGAANYVAASGEWGTYTDGPARKAALEAMTRRLANESGRYGGTDSLSSVTTTCRPDPGCDDLTFDSIRVELGVLPSDPFRRWRTATTTKRFAILSTVNNPNTVAPSTP